MTKLKQQQQQQQQPIILISHPKSHVIPLVLRLEKVIYKFLGLNTMCISFLRIVKYLKFPNCEFILAC